ncbi:hypothetical protein LBMAG42_08620 [Deltaproteobacteria bacterium]|nr:hypothetical protein LBMAG42_08620 [Deltaproteobacteria bacterium]
MGPHELIALRRTSQLVRRSRGLVAAPRGGILVPPAPPVVYGLVPEAIAAFLEASRRAAASDGVAIPTDWDTSELPPSRLHAKPRRVWVESATAAFDLAPFPAYEEEPTVCEERPAAQSAERGPGLRDMASFFADSDPRLEFFDVVDGPVAEPMCDIEALEAPEPGHAAPAGAGARMQLVRALPAPRKVAAIPGADRLVPVVDPRAGLPPRRHPRSAGLLPFGLALSAVLAVVSGGLLLRDMMLSGPAGQAMHSGVGTLRAPRGAAAQDRGAMSALSGLFRNFLSAPREPVELQEVGTPAGEMVAVEPGFGVLEIVVDRDSDVWIDGGPRGVVQGSGLFTLPSGDHDVEVRAGGELESRQIDVADGEAVRLDLGEAFAEAG